jgi:DNA-binding transcriptional MerR regulator
LRQERPLTKAPLAFRTISEVSETLDVPQHVLRFWEGKFPQVKPMKRAGGRRYYRPDDIELLRGVRALLYSEGYTIKGVQKMLRESGARHVCEIGRFGSSRVRSSGGAPADLGRPSEAGNEDVIAWDALNAADTAAQDQAAALHYNDPELKMPAVRFGADNLGAATGEGLAQRRAKLEAALVELLTLRDLLRGVRARQVKAA